MIRSLSCLLAAIVAAMFGMHLFTRSAHAQVTDKPILKMPADISKVTIDIDGANQKACAVWFERDSDPFGDWHLVRTFCEGAACGAIQGDITKMTLARTRNVASADVARCMSKLGAPPPPVWIVAAAVDGPAYCVNVDGTRGKECARAPATFKIQDTNTQNWCRCDVLRSKELPGAATYCLPAMTTEQRLDRQRLVTRCKKNPAS